MLVRRCSDRGNVGRGDDLLCGAAFLCPLHPFYVLVDIVDVAANNAHHIGGTLLVAVKLFRAHGKIHVAVIPFEGFQDDIIPIKGQVLQVFCDDRWKYHAGGITQVVGDNVHELFPCFDPFGVGLIGALIFVVVTIRGFKKGKGRTVLTSLSTANSPPFGSMRFCHADTCHANSAAMVFRSAMGRSGEENLAAPDAARISLALAFVSASAEENLAAIRETY